MNQTTYKLQVCLSRLGFSPGKLDGQDGPRTRGALSAAGFGVSDAVALEALRGRLTSEMRGLPAPTLEDMQALAGAFPRKWLNDLHKGIIYAHITASRLPFFLAQLAHESAGFKTLVEYGNDAYFSRYDGRADLGNTEPGDGLRYKGRGVIQLTGRANYRRYGSLLGVDLETLPKLAEEPRFAFKIAALYWLDRNLNALTDADDFEAVTRKINGGLNGIADRRRYLEAARSLFDHGAAPQPATAPETPELLTPSSPAPSPEPLPPTPPPLEVPAMPIIDHRTRRRVLRRLFRDNKDFWVGQYLSYLDEGLEPDEALSETREDFRDWALAQLAQRLDKAVRWRFIQNADVRARFEEADGGMFLTMLKAALRLIEQTRRPVAGLLGGKGEDGPLRGFYDAFSDLLDGSEPEPAVIETQEAPSERPTEIRRSPGMVIEAPRPRPAAQVEIPQYEAPTRAQVIDADGAP